MLRIATSRFLLTPICRARTMKGKTKVRSKYKNDYFSDEDSEDFSMNFMYSQSAPSSPIFTSNKMNYIANTHIKPKNKHQEDYIKLLDNPKPSIVVASGPAGVAKTYLCNAIGIKKLINGEVDKLIITRPAVSVDEEHGFLPGSLEDKMDPWMRPIYDVFYKFISPIQVKNLIAKQQIEICPLAYMRGRTFENSWICADEMQNSTPLQMLMLLTRIGNNSKLIITGDPYQHDRGFYNNGFSDFIKKIKHANLNDLENEVGLIEFDKSDIERSNAVKIILNMYSNN